MTDYINDTPAPAPQPVSSLSAGVYFFDDTDLFFRVAVDNNLKVADPSVTWLDNHWGAQLVNRKVNVIVPVIHFSTPAV